MEYPLALSQGPAAMRDIRRLMQTRHPDCTWAVEYRTQPGEQSLLSPTRGKESVTISLHQAMDLPYEPLFRDAEAIFLAYDGRPHWGKLHFLSSAEIGDLYPELPAFQVIRAEMDRGARLRMTIWRGWDCSLVMMLRSKGDCLALTQPDTGSPSLRSMQCRFRVRQLVSRIHPRSATAPRVSFHSEDNSRIVASALVLRGPAIRCRKTDPAPR